MFCPIEGRLHRLPHRGLDPPDAHGGRPAPEPVLPGPDHVGPDHEAEVRELPRDPAVQEGGEGPPRAHAPAGGDVHDHPLRTHQRRFRLYQGRAAVHAGNFVVLAFGFVIFSQQMFCGSSNMFFCFFKVIMPVNN